MALAAILLLAGPAPPALAQAIELPDIGESAATVATPQREQQVGKAAMLNILQARGGVEDPLLAQYIQSLGYRLLAGADAGAQPFRFFLIDEPDINAFALPGGFIGVHTGLILATDSEDELAAVLAHEIAHVTQRHHARSYEAASGTDLATAAGILAAMILGAQNSELGEAAIATVTAGAVQKQIDFTRANEQEADRLGMTMLVNAGFDPESMPSFFERLQRETRLYGPEAPEFLRTHPVTVSRIADARNRIPAGASKERAPEHGDKTYALMQARLRVLAADDRREPLLHFEESLKQGTFADQDAARYGHALALIANARHAEALKTLEPLLVKDPYRIPYVIAKADALQGRGDLAAAQGVLAEALEIAPNNPPLTLHYAETLLRAGKPDQARELLGSFVREAAPNIHAYRLLSDAASRSGHRGEARQALAEYHYLQGQLHEAIKQLNIALRENSDDFYRASRIEARLSELEQEASVVE